MTDYLVVTSPENWQKTAEMGWSLLGLKSTRHNVARSLRPGDRLACYETGVKRFIAVVQIAGDCYEDHTPIWGGKKAGEDYPYRYPIKPIVAVEPDQALDAVALSQELEFPKKWGTHLSLAFQGNIKPIPAGDIAKIGDALGEVKAATPAPA
ncbi:MAG TPA: EVE domain-containing protein [Dehalococcoidia bacterium]|nr:EVE domain-containing protein [Dehalococcoidia bacterium]